LHEGEIDMRDLVLLAISAFLIVTSSSVGAAPLSPAGIARSDQSAIILVQDKPKKGETLKQKAKRVWRNLTGYKFAVACPAIFTVSRHSCTETGKSREEARAKCQSQSPLCAISDAK
jgi:hypothetical protein